MASSTAAAGRPRSSPLLILHQQAVRRQSHAAVGLRVLDADRRLWEATAQHNARTVYTSSGEATWVGWSHDGMHWAMTEACEEDGSRLIIDGEPFGDYAIIHRARWSNRQAVLVYETSAEQGGPALRPIDLNGRELVIGDARAPRFSP